MDGNSAARIVVTTGKLVAVLALMCVVPGSASAGPRFGVDVGVVFSGLNYEVELPWWSSNDWRVAPTAGTSVEFPMRANLSFSTGLRYLRVGNRVKFDTGAPSPLVGEFTLTQDYLTVPALLVVRPGGHRRVSFSFGPELAVLIAAATHLEGTGDVVGDPVTVDDVDDIRVIMNSVVLMGTAAVACEFPRGTRNWSVQVRTTFGLTEAAQDDDWETNWRSVGIETTAGLRW